MPGPIAGQEAHQVSDEDLPSLGCATHRAASTTGTPNQSPSSVVASPTLIPTRIANETSPCRLV